MKNKNKIHSKISLIYSSGVQTKLIFYKFKTIYNAKRTFRYADQVFNGDELLVQDNGGMIPVKVINISAHLMQGNFTPKTVRISGPLLNIFVY